MMAKRAKTRGKGSPESSMPSAQTLFRYQLANAAARAALQEMADRMGPMLMLRDGPRIQRIRNAQTVEEVVDLAPLAVGAVANVWQERLQEFGPDALPPIAERLPQIREIEDEDRQDKIYEALITALRWQGNLGARVLMEHFDALNTYAQSLACVVLGILKAQAAADQIWTYYRRVANNAQEHFFIGGLWGLIDLKDERAGEALAGLAEKQRYFVELPPFLFVAGDDRAIIPLMLWLLEASAARRTEILAGLLGIVHRVGRERSVAVLREAMPDDPPEKAEEIIDGMLERPIDEIRQQFDAILSGPTLEDLNRVIDEEL